ncbi:photosynthetic complex assembly protein 2 [Methylocella silvestris BL2]|uniref:Photosynthetic complex assembly protein 2 n=1 Tax=Methylocella silvestris (strain DSM 15510 / CIP 108128 / LMG 27833 / NCIMB 13906 / BL2) TaxID=395965 RepID=B8EPW7_METSB|nr:putative photosynthetic complex assembly protein PuhE [Methylocella silvestris]ACK50971.1 photosynthetic complex assembly protein 2 [Methylocella silvestris BL2]
MSDYGLPILYCLFVWWFSTGLVIYVNGLPSHTFRWSLLAATALMGLSFYGLARSSADTTIGGAYLAFSCALMIWAWHEMSFLMGVVTGPRRTPCPEGAAGFQRFRFSFEAVLYHELAILVTALCVVAATAGGPNQIGAATFMILWVMRLSAKLNIFFGVLNLTENFLPAPIQYLKSYFKKSPMNLLFPVSVTASTVAAVLLAQHAIAPGAPDFQRAGYAFLASLMILAIVEHWFLVLPLPAEKLWSWSLKARRTERKSAPGPAQDARIQALVLEPLAGAGE